MYKREEKKKDYIKYKSLKINSLVTEVNYTLFLIH